MRLLDKLTSQPKQSYTFTSDGGTAITFSLIYMPTQQLWQFSLSCANLTLDGAMLLNSINGLHGYKNLIDFGLMITSSDGQDPAFLDDFTTGRVSLYLLNAAEVQTIEAQLFT